MKLLLVKIFLVWLAVSANLGKCPEKCRCHNKSLTCKGADKLNIQVGGRWLTSVVLVNTTVSSVTCANTEMLKRLKHVYFINSGPPRLLCQLLRCGSLSKVVFYDQNVSILYIWF